MQRAIEVALYAPIGAAALVVDVAPDVLRTVVARGRAEVEVRQEQVARPHPPRQGCGRGRDRVRCADAAPQGRDAARVAAPDRSAPP